MPREQHRDVRGCRRLPHPALLLCDHDQHFTTPPSGLISSVVRSPRARPSLRSSAIRSGSFASRSSRPTRCAHRASIRPNRWRTHETVCEGAAITSTPPPSIAISSSGSSQIANALSPTASQQRCANPLPVGEGVGRWQAEASPDLGEVDPDCAPALATAVGDVGLLDRGSSQPGSPLQGGWGGLPGFWGSGVPSPRARWAPGFLPGFLPPFLPGFPSARARKVSRT